MQGTRSARSWLSAAGPGARSLTALALSVATIAGLAACAPDPVVPLAPSSTLSRATVAAAMAGPDTNCVLPHPPDTYPGIWFETRNPTTVQNCGTEIVLSSPVMMSICEPDGFCGGYFWWAHGLSGTPYDVHDFQSARGSAGRILHIRFSRPLLKFVLRSQNTVYPNNRIVAYDSLSGGTVIGEFLLPLGQDSRDSIVFAPSVAGQGGIRRIEITPDPSGSPSASSGWGEGLRMRVEFQPDTNCVTNDRVLDDMNVRRDMKRFYDESKAEGLEKAGFIGEPDDKSGPFSLVSTDGLIARPPRLPAGVPDRSICHSITPGADPFPDDAYRYEAGWHTHIVAAGKEVSNCPIGSGRTASNGPSGFDLAGLKDLSGRMYIIDPDNVWRVFKDGSKRAFPRRDKSRQCTMF